MARRPQPLPLGRRLQPRPGRPNPHRPAIMTTDLIAWLRAQLDEDERIAVDAALLADSERWTASARNGWDEIRDGRHRRVAEARNDERTHIARHDPARVLAEVEATDPRPGRRIPGLDRRDSQRGQLHGHRRPDAVDPPRARHGLR